VWAIQNIWGLVGSEKGGDNALFHVTQEPQIRYVPHASEDIDQLVPTNECHTEERSASCDLRVVEIPNMALGGVQDGNTGALPVDARVVERRRELIHKKVPVEPA
jgi:hypothetical protein